MKKWLLGEGSAKELGLDLDAEVTRLEGFDSVSFKSGGTIHQYSMDEIRCRVKYETRCQGCLEKQLEIDALKAQLTEKPDVPLRALVKKFIEENYTRTHHRKYQRTQLRREIDEYLRTKYNRRMRREDDLWRYVREELLGDQSRTYQRLRIEKRTTWCMYVGENDLGWTVRDKVF